jgi:hypothetical protein
VPDLFCLSPVMFIKARNNYICVWMLW